MHSKFGSPLGRCYVGAEPTVTNRTADDARTDELRRHAAELAHDLNNAISSVLLNAHLALEALESGAPARTEVEEIRKAGESAAAVMRRLQALGRGERA
jgi:signal transduction histidine kinase